MDIDDSDDLWRKAAVSNPRAWNDPNNSITERVIGMLCMDQGTSPLHLGQAKRHYRTAAVELLTQAGGDPETVLDALEECRKAGGERWMNLQLFQQRASAF